MGLKKQLIRFLLPLVFFSKGLCADDVCRSYQSLTSEDRQNISDTRYELESLSPSLPISQYRHQFNVILSRHARSFSTPLMSDYLLGLKAEALFHRMIFETIGIENLTYKRFRIFADLVLYHKAMDHKAFVDIEQFTKSRRELESSIHQYFDLQSETIQKQNQFTSEELNTQFISGKPFSPKQRAFAELWQQMEVERSSLLGALELVWSQLLYRNQQNQMETTADIALQVKSINIATAMIAFTGLVGYGPSLLQHASELWSLPVSFAVGCGFGVGTKYFSERFTAGYLEMGRALYRATKNHTSFACELGREIHSDAPPETVKIPDETSPAQSKDYLKSCGLVGTSMIFPTTLSLGMSGMLLVALGQSTHTLARQAIVLMEEIPKLYRLKAQAEVQRNPEELALIEKQIEQAKLKTTLYFIAFGNTSWDALRTGIFLYGGRDQLKDLILRSRQFLQDHQYNKDLNLRFLSLLLGALN